MTRERKADEPKRKAKAHDDRDAMELAETTDVSPNQAKELLAKHGKEEAAKRAKNFKAEG